MKLTPKNWSKFQHYKDRSPVWIKLHRELLDDYEFYCLPVASKALAPMLWLLASEYEGGVIDATLQKLAFRLHMTEAEVAEALNPLIEANLFALERVASEPLAPREQNACLEKRREETEKNIRRVAKATATDESFEEFWREYPKRKGDNPKNPARKLFEAAVKQGADPNAIISAVKIACARNREKIGTEYIPQAVKWLRDRRWEDYTETIPTPVDWRKRMEFWAKSPAHNRDWFQGWGPAPDQSGCEVPRDLLVEFGALSAVTHETQTEAA